MSNPMNEAIGDLIDSLEETGFLIQVLRDSLQEEPAKAFQARMIEAKLADAIRALQSLPDA